ncbi:unnamed protein product [Ectocarpus sp. 12 AP-2014]
MASAECFCSGVSRHTTGANEEISTGAPLVDANETSETASGAHAAADGTAAGIDTPFKSAADVSQEATVDGVGVDKPEGSGEIEAGVGEGKGEKDSSSAGGDDVDLGVAALRTLLQSFAILDWSLFG